MHLLMKEAFDLGYRRLELVCDNADESAKNEATRLGFDFEGVLRQRYVVGGSRNRDDCCFAILDRNWPVINQAFIEWLSDKNHANAAQPRRLSE